MLFCWRSGDRVFKDERRRRDVLAGHADGLEDDNRIRIEWLRSVENFAEFSINFSLVATHIARFNERAFIRVDDDDVRHGVGVQFAAIRASPTDRSDFLPLELRSLSP